MVLNFAFFAIVKKILAKVKHAKINTYIENSKSQLTCNSNNIIIQDMYRQTHTLLTGFTGKLHFLSLVVNNVLKVQAFSQNTMQLRTFKSRNCLPSYLPDVFVKIKAREILSRQNSEIKCPQN